MKKILLKINSLIRRYWVFVAVLIITIIFLSTTSPDKKPLLKEQSASSGFSWRNISPGKTTKSEIKNELGQPLKEYGQEGRTVVEYPSVYEYYPDKIFIEQGKVVLIREQIAYEQNLKLETYLKEYGEPSLVLYEENLGEPYPISIFLEKGMAIAAHISDGSIMEIWYFEPMLESEFNLTVGKDLLLKLPQKF